MCDTVVPLSLDPTVTISDTALEVALSYAMADICDRISDAKQQKQAIKDLNALHAKLLHRTTWEITAQGLRILSSDGTTFYLNDGTTCHKAYDAKKICMGWQIHGKCHHNTAYAHLCIAQMFEQM